MSKEFSLPDVESIDEVPDEFRPFYFERDGKVQKQNPAAMASTLAKVRRENEKLAQELLERQNALAQFRDVLGDDADPEVIKQLKVKAARADTLPTDQEVEKRIRLVEENAAKQTAQLKKELELRERLIEQEAVKVQIRAALQQADANKDGLDLLPDLLRSRVEKVYTEDGRIKLIPLDSDGTRMYADDGSEATLADLANRLKDERPIFFNGSGARGLGTSGEAVTVPRDAKDPSKMSPQEKSEFIKKHGSAAYATLLMRAARAS